MLSSGLIDVIDRLKSLKRHLFVMQELNNDTFDNQYSHNDDNSHDIGKSISGKRFIECIRCGRHIKNDPKVIKNHEYYCRNKELAATNKISSENEYADNKYMEELPAPENATVEPVSDKKRLIRNP